MHSHHFLPLILSIFLLLHDARLARRKVIVECATTVTGLDSAGDDKGLRALLVLSLQLRAGTVDEVLSVFDGLLAGGLSNDVVLLKSFVDSWRNDGLDILKVRIKDDILRGYSLLGVKNKHLLQQNHQPFTARFEQAPQPELVLFPALVLRIAFEPQFLELPKPQWPVALTRFPQNIEDSVQLIDIIRPWEQGISEVQFNNDTSQGEDIDKAAILLRPQQILRRAVPSGGHIIGGHLVQRNRKSKIDEFNLRLPLVDEYILWFDIPVYNSLLVDVGQAEGDLKQYALDLLLTQSKLLFLVQFQRILREVLEHHLRLSLYRILFEVQQPHDVGMLEIFKKISLFQSYILMRFHYLHGCGLPVLGIANQVHGTEVSAAHFLQQLIFVHRDIINVLAALTHTNHSLYSHPSRRRQSIEEGLVVQRFKSISPQQSIHRISKNCRPNLSYTQARCTLKTLKRKQQMAERKNMAMAKGLARPRMKLRGRTSIMGLNCTLNSHIFFISLSVQVSLSFKMVDLTAATSNWCCVTSDSLYFSAALSLGGSSSFLGRALRSIFFLMSLMVWKVVTRARRSSSMRRTILWQFWKVVDAMGYNRSIKFKYKGKGVRYNSSLTAFRLQYPASQLPSTPTATRGFACSPRITCARCP